MWVHLNNQNTFVYLKNAPPPPHYTHTHFTEPQGSLLSSQESITCLCPEPEQPSQPQPLLHKERNKQTNTYTARSYFLKILFFHECKKKMFQTKVLESNREHVYVLYTFL
jgi:hypothetical protein